MRRISIIVLSVMITVCTLGQELGKLSSQTAICNKSALIGSLNTAPWLPNTSGLYQTVSLIPFWTIRYSELNLPVIANMESFSRLTTEPLLFNSLSANLSWKTIALSRLGTNDISNIKWLNLNLSPSFVPGRNYYDLLSRNPWSINTNPWIYDTFWTALIRNSFLFINHRQ
jgi:hypothetical protein